MLKNLICCVCKKDFNALYPGRARFCSTKCRVQNFRNLKVEMTPNIPRSGITGVTYDREHSKWRAKVGTTYLGIHDTILEARAAIEHYKSNLKLLINL